MMALRVAVVGAGAAGLSALRYLTKQPKQFVPVAYEMTGQVSGTWVYTDRVGKDEFGLPVHSSMYKNLRTNLPKEAMAFIDFPFPQHLPSFVGHEDVRKYLEDYADQHNLHDHIQFHTKVDTITPKTASGGRQVWNVETFDVTRTKSETYTKEFDAVIVANGHYSVPLYPDLSGMNQFRGLTLHSHDYRAPDKFADMRVAVLGGAASGQDISLDIANVAKKVYLCHKNIPLTTNLPHNVSQEPAIKEVLTDGVILTNNKELKLDALLFCTGYKYDYSFLSSECSMDTKDERVIPLYKHIIHTKYPTLSIIGVTKQICPFPQFDCQVRFILAALTGKMRLPSKEEMERDTQKDFQWRTNDLGYPVRHAHLMGQLQWDYNNTLARLAGFEALNPVTRKLFEHIHATRTQNLLNFKHVNYKLLDDEEFLEIRN